MQMCMFADLQICARKLTSLQIPDLEKTKSRESSLPIWLLFRHIIVDAQSATFRKKTKTKNTKSMKIHSNPHTGAKVLRKISAG